MSLILRMERENITKSVVPTTVNIAILLWKKHLKKQTKQTAEILNFLSNSNIQRLFS